MAFSHTIDPAAPSGGSQVSLGDDAIRELAAAVLERLTSAFQDPDADPMLVKNGAVHAAQLDAVLKLRSIIRAQYSVSDSVTTGSSLFYVFGVPGVSVGDNVSCCLIAAPTDANVKNCVFNAFVSAADAISLQIYNPTSTTVVFTDDAVDLAIIKTTFLT